MKLLENFCRVTGIDYDHIEAYKAKRAAKAASRAAEEVQFLEKHLEFLRNAGFSDGDEDFQEVQINLARARKRAEKLEETTKSKLDRSNRAAHSDEEFSERPVDPRRKFT